MGEQQQKWVSMALLWIGEGRAEGQLLPPQGRKALPANPLAALCLPASQNASLLDPPLAIGQRGGRRALAGAGGGAMAGAQGGAGAWPAQPAPSHWV